MKDGKKNGFFSWLNSTIRKKKTIDLKNNEKLEDHKKNLLEEKTIKKYIDIHKKSDNSHLTLTSKSDLDDKIETISNYKANKILKITNPKKNFFIQLKKSLLKTKKFFGEGISRIFLSKKIDHVLFEELEEKMILSDIGVNTTNRIIQKLINDIDRKELKNSEKIYYLLKKNMCDILKKVEIPLVVSGKTPFIILVTGVNGVGKTTTAAKLAKKYKLQGKSVILVAADTFRAAGIEQLKILGKLNDIPVISQVSGTDPASVVFDAVKSAISKKIDVLIIDTAGRLHNKLHLMEELKKIVRVIKKIDSSAPHETMLIVDACNGQNTVQQTKMFHKALNLTGIIITKLDGTAKGGVIFSLSDQFSIPIRYIGIGEKTKDLDIFNSQDFIKAIFD